MVIERRLVGLRELVTVLLDVRRGPDLFLRNRHLQLIGTNRDPAERHERQVATDEALFDRRELGLVSFDIDVHVLQLADLFAVAIDERR